MKQPNFKITKIDKNTITYYLSLAHAYEAEFSNLTHKLPDESGIFHPDTMPVDPCVGYLLYVEKLPVGFCVANTKGAIHDIAEFYVIPVMRRQQLGLKLATAIFDKYPGQWQVRQIEGAEQAINFWRHVINTYTDGNYDEAIVDDPDWGTVTRQSFITPQR